jgi:DNA ligase-associated metallophosphoesterase
LSDLVETVIAGERVVLFADRALFWPRESALLIADLHLGKADTFRAAGIALPSGGTRHDLDRLSALIERTRADRLIVLGDMLHASAKTKRWRETWDAWRAQHSALRIDVIAGNHDRALMGAGLDIEHHLHALAITPFLLRHLPGQIDDAHVVCGHVHPVVRLPRLAGRWPVFALGEKQTILPSFSAFTGGGEIDVAGPRLAVCNGREIALLG